MKLGANEPKKVAVLGVLVLVGGYLSFTTVLSGPSVPSTRTSAPPLSANTASIPPAAATAGADRPVPRRAISGRGRSDECHPVLHSKRPEDRVDPVKVDLTLRLDLLANLLEVGLPAGGRNPFEMGAPPPPKAEVLKGPETEVPLQPVQVEVRPAPAPGYPPPPPITLKYYGLVAKEGDTLKKRYRVVRNGVNSVVMEDTDSKREQTLPLAEDAG